MGCWIIVTVNLTGLETGDKNRQGCVCEEVSRVG